MGTCRKLAAAFYARVEHDPVLRAVYPSSTFKCAIEGLALFLAEFLGGPREHSETRWTMSLRDMHVRFKIGQKEREHWLEKMFRGLDDVQVAEPSRTALRQFFDEASAYLIDHPEASKGPRQSRPTPIEGEIARRWDAQRSLEEVASAVRQGDAARAIDLADRLQDRTSFLFLLGMMTGSGDLAMTGYVRRKLLADPELTSARYASSRTLLHEASGNGNLAIVQLLLDLGANPNAPDHSGRTPLYYAGNSCVAESGGDAVRALVRAGADVNAQHGVNRCTALRMAARRGYVAAAEALIDCGADIEARDRAGDTPLRRSVNCGKADVAALLLSRGPIFIPSGVVG
jgi:truncated hemoglobin YjbI